MLPKSSLRLIGLQALLIAIDDPGADTVYLHHRIALGPAVA